MLAAYLINQANRLWGKKWRLSIVWVLRNGPKRFSQIKNELPGISVKVLSEALKELEEHDLVIRKQYPTIPVKVTYSLHEDTMPLLKAQEVYVDCLSTFFGKHQDRYNFPDWVRDTLRKEVSTKQPVDFL